MLWTRSLHDRRSMSSHFAGVWVVAVVGVMLAGTATANADEPELVYQEFYGQFGYLQPHDIVVDGEGQAYVLAARSGSNYATFVMKLDVEGGVLWSQWIDGSSHDIPGAIAIDAVGDVYVVGTTGSADFPTMNPLQAAQGSVQYDAFVVKLSGIDGMQLYGTYLGGVRSEWGSDIAVNDDGEMYIAGSTESLNFPVVNALQDELAGWPYYGWSDGYVAKISADGSELLYSTFYGGYYDDAARGIALDDSGRIYIVGETNSDDFPTENAAQIASGGGRDGFAARISADGSEIEYSTYLGGEDIESVRAVALGIDGRLYLCGHTESIHFPTTDGAYQEDFVGEILGCEVPFGADYNCDDVFIAALEPDGTYCDYATYLGGHQIDHGYGLAVTPSGQVYVTGHTKSDDFPPEESGTFFSNYLSKLDQTGGELMYSIFHDTVTPSAAYVALDQVGDIYFAATVNTPNTLVVMKLSEGGVHGDFNGDGCVDLSDLSALLSEYDCAGDCAYDMDGDDDVDLGDLADLLSMYGYGC